MRLKISLELLLCSGAQLVLCGKRCSLLNTLPRDAHRPRGFCGSGGRERALHGFVDVGFYRVEHVARKRVLGREGNACGRSKKREHQYSGDRTSSEEPR